MSQSDEPVWVLLGQRTGDNNQLLRLAGELELPFRAIELDYNALHFLPPQLLGTSLASLTRESRAKIEPPWPRLVLGIGHRSVPAALAIRKMSGGKSKLVRLGNPRVDPSKFDIVITTPQYRLPARANVLQLPLGISTAPAVEPMRDESEWLERLPRPHRLLLVGGDSFMWTLRAEKVAAAATRLKEKPGGGGVIAVRSGRSKSEVLEQVAEALKGSQHALVSGRFPRYAVLIQDADEIYVTSDSVAMVSDAIASGKPVGTIRPDQSMLGRFLYALDSIGLRVPIRDIRQFWAEITRQELAGSVDEPKCGRMARDPLFEARTAVRALLDD